MGMITLYGLSDVSNGPYHRNAMNPNLSFDRIVVHERHWPIVIGRTGLQIANQKFTRVSGADNEGPPSGRTDNLQPFSECANGQSNSC